MWWQMVYKQQAAPLVLTKPRQLRCILQMLDQNISLLLKLAKKPCSTVLITLNQPTKQTKKQSSDLFPSRPCLIFCRSWDKVAMWQGVTALLTFAWESPQTLPLMKDAASSFHLRIWGTTHKCVCWIAQNVNNKAGKMLIMHKSQLKNYKNSKRIHWESESFVKNI